MVFGLESRRFHAGVLDIGRGFLCYTSASQIFSVFIVPWWFPRFRFCDRSPHTLDEDRKGVGRGCGDEYVVVCKFAVLGLSS